MPIFVGVDWGSAEHAACVVDRDGQIRGSWPVAHTRAGLAELLARLSKFGTPDTLPIAIERPSGLLVDTLVEAGHPVFPIHPNAVAATRPRYRAANSKSDATDAFILADILRTDGHRFSKLEPYSDAIKSLRGLVRTRDDLVATRVMTTNRLRALLAEFWPGPLHLFYDLESPISLAFLKRFSSPTAAQKLTARKLKHFLERQSYTGRKTPDELLQALRSRPVSVVGRAQEDANACQMLSFVAILETLVGQIKVLTQRIEAQLADMPMAQIITSLPRSGMVNAAKLVAEIGDVSRFQTPDHLAAEAGVAPVTDQSGRHRAVGFRYACNRNLRQAITCFADVSRHGSPWAADIYRRAVDRGCLHPHAIRILARAWARIIWRCLKDAAPYDPARHRGAQQALLSVSTSKVDTE